MTNGSEYAVPRGVDAHAVERGVREAHEQFLDTGRADTMVRPLVLDSWRRSLDRGLDPESVMAPVQLDDDALAHVRQQHPLAVGMPVVRSLLVESASEAGLLVAVSDAAGQLLWVEGADDLRRRAESMLFVAGANWSEACVGTNAPGTALALDRPVQLLGHEHLARPVTAWSCSAAPVHDPDTGAVLGVLDLTGGSEVATAQSLNLVRAAAAAVEAELRIDRLRSTRRPSLRRRAATTVGGWSRHVDARHRLEVLGRRTAVLSLGATDTELSLRHSELLLLLAGSRRGFTTAELSVSLSHDDPQEVTIRAELSRLRGVLGPVELASRPYRVNTPLDTDVQDLRAALEAGRVRAAVELYRGPVLPDSQAPAVEELREEVHMLLRSHLLVCDDVDALLSFADTAHGRDDFEVWERALDLLSVDSPRYVQVAAHVEKLDREFA